MNGVDSVSKGRMAKANTTTDHYSSSASQNDRTADPFALAESIAESAKIEVLALVISPPAAYVEMHGSPVRFRCPRCRVVDHNGGHAEIRSTWRWWCERCRTQGTISELRRIALETPDAVKRLLAGAT